MHVKILNPDAARKAAKTAITELASVVKQTLGPGGNPIVLQRSGVNPDGTPVAPLITKDGVTVAEHVSLRDPALDTFAKTIIQVAQNTVKAGGDGTTTAVVLAEAIFTEGFRHLEQGENGIQLYEDLKRVKDIVLAALDSEKREVKTREDLKAVAKISANGNEEIAEIVVSALEAVGEEGYVSLEEGSSRDTILDIVEGAVYKQGWRKWGPHGSLQVTDKARNICELQKPGVLLYAGKIDSVVELHRLMCRLMDEDQATGELKKIFPLLIIAHDFSDDVKNHIVAKRIQNHIPIAAIKSPFDGTPNARTEMMHDLAAILGATVSAQGILDLANVTETHLGSAEKVEIGPEETVIYNGYGNPEEIMKRIEDLNTLASTMSLSTYDLEMLNLRKGKLSGGVAIIRVGGDSELEMKEKKDRIEDALCAARVASKEGVVRGGGYALYQIAGSLSGSDMATKIMKSALQAPIRQIIKNAGKNPDVILTEMWGKGYDARKRNFVADVMEEGIIDPVKVTKSALENAVSIAGLLLTTGGALVSDIEPKDGTPNPFAGLF